MPLRNFVRYKIHFASKSCVVLYWQQYCAALEQWASPKLCSMVSSRTAPEAEYFWPAGFLCGWFVGVELVAVVPERPGSQQRHFLQAPKDIFVCSVVIYVQRIRGFTAIRYINLYVLLTYFTLSPATYKLYNTILTLITHTVNGVDTEGACPA